MSDKSLNNYVYAKSGEGKSILIELAAHIEQSRPRRLRGRTDLKDISVDDLSLFLFDDEKSICGIEGMDVKLKDLCEPGEPYFHAEVDGYLNDSEISMNDAVLNALFFAKNKITSY